MSESQSLSFTADIRPMFRDRDVAHMKPFGIDLSSHDDVAKRAEDILSVVTGGTMPPPSDNAAWTPEMREKFRRWMDAGCPA